MRSVGVLAAFGCLVALGAGACGDDDVPLGSLEGDASSDADADSTMGEPDATRTVGLDASTDADADVAVDAASPTCSIDGYCHTTLPSPQTLRDVWSDGLGVAWAVSAQGNILRWDGASWSIVHTVPGRLLAIWGSGPTDLWAGGDDGLFHGTGATSSAIMWAAVATPGDATIPINSIWGTGPTDVWAVGRPQPPSRPRVGRVLHFGGDGGDGAPTWSVDSLSLQPIGFIEVWGSSGSDVWIGGDRGSSGREQGVVFRRTSSSGGTSWSEVALPLDANGGRLRLFTTGGSASPDDVWVFGTSTSSATTIWRGTRSDGGVFGWTVEATLAVATWAVRGTSRSDAWSAGDYGRIRHWDGSGWTQARITVTSFPFTRPFYATWGGAAGELWFVGEDVALHRPASSNP